MKECVMSKKRAVRGDGKKTMKRIKKKLKYFLVLDIIPSSYY